jgi:uncharacterized membrane protein
METHVVVKATENLGTGEKLSTMSDQFIINILPVNDEPEVGTVDFPDISISEGGKSKGFDLLESEYFVDVDSTVLYFDSLVDPLEEIEDENLSVMVDNDAKMMTITSHGDYFTPSQSPLRLRIFCDDDPDEINKSTAYQDIFVTVVNLDDDAPVWDPIPTVYMKEDTPKDDAVNLYDYVRDNDNSNEDLKFSIVDISNDKIQVDIDNQANLDIRSEENYFGKANVDIRASDGTNVGSTSFDIVIENVNDQPEVELLAPRNNALIFADRIELQWSGSDVDPGDEKNLSYSIYMDSISGTTLYKENHKETSIVITDLTDKSTYYWKVIPYDGSGAGECISDPCPAQFTIDLGQKPHSILKLPGDEAVTNSDYIILIWGGYSDEGYMISYDIYLSLTPLEEPYPDSTLIKKSTTETQLLVENLTSGQTYYWTVIPKTAKGVGTCDSGVWSFMYDPTATPYDLEIMGPSEIIVEKGEDTNIAIRIKNSGANPDIVIPGLDAGELKFAIALEDSGNELALAKDETKILILNISADKIPVGKYDITITAESIGGRDIEQSKISLTVIEKDVKEEGLSLAAASFFIIPIIIIIILAIAFFLFARKKRKEEEQKRVEAEVLKPVPAAAAIDAADVQYFPGAPGTGAVPSQLPHVTMPGGAAGQVPTPAPTYGAGGPVPQLPPGAPGAVPPAPQPQPAVQTPVQPQVQPQPAPVYPQTPQAAPSPQPTEQAQQFQWQAPAQEAQPQVQTPPSQPSPPQYTTPPPSSERSVKTGSPPIQVPYIPKQKTETPESPPPVPEQPPEVTAGPEPSAMELLETIKARYIQGGVTEETYMTLKKELKEIMQKESQPGAPAAQIDNVVKRFIKGEISENEYKRQRGL